MVCPNAACLDDDGNRRWLFANRVSKCQNCTFCGTSYGVGAGNALAATSARAASTSATAKKPVEYSAQDRWMWQLLSGLESSPQVELAKKDLITRVPGIDKPPEVKFSAKFAEATHAFQKAMRARDNTLEKIIKLEDQLKQLQEEFQERQNTYDEAKENLAKVQKVAKIREQTSSEGGAVPEGKRPVLDQLATLWKLQTLSTLTTEEASDLARLEQMVQEGYQRVASRQQAVDGPAVALRGDAESDITMEGEQTTQEMETESDARKREYIARAQEKAKRLKNAGAVVPAAGAEPSRP